MAALLIAVAAVALYALRLPPGDGSPEAGFARDMSVHHAQAVEMASIVSRRTENERVRTLADDIVLTQQAQIGQMQGWLAVWGLPQTGSDPRMAWMGHDLQPGERMPGMATREEVNSLQEASPERMDEEFLRLMVTHHRAAIPMSGAVLDRTDRPEVERLAGAISASQESEIQVMREMLRRMGADVESGEPDPMEDMEGMDT